MNKKITIYLMLSIVGSISFAQTQEEDKTKIDVFLSKYIVNNTELDSIKFLNDVAVSTSQTLVLASSNCFYSIGYGNYSIRTLSGKSISSFCIVGDNVFFTDKNVLYRIGADNEETMIKRLPFTPQKIWSGKNVLYMVTRIGETNKLYVYFPEKNEQISLFSTIKSIIVVTEFGAMIFVLTPETIFTIDIRSKNYSENPLNINEMGNAQSIAVDKENGDLYISAEKGVFRTCQGQLQKICVDNGVLCYDVDGMILFNKEKPCLLRFRSDFLHSMRTEKKVIIEIR